MPRESVWPNPDVTSSLPCRCPEAGRVVDEQTVDERLAAGGRQARHEPLRQIGQTGCATIGAERGAASHVRTQQQALGVSGRRHLQQTVESRESGQYFALPAPS
jgi:hypothetical protein